MTWLKIKKLNILVFMVVITSDLALKWKSNLINSWEEFVTKITSQYRL